MIKTAITEMFGVQYPIICGAMMWLCKPSLCAAVSNAGGIGNLTAANYETEEDFRALENNLKLQEFYLANPGPEKIFELDNEYHMMLYRICNKMQCYYMVRLMSLHFDRVRNMSLYSVKELKIVADHRMLFEAIKAGDKDAAREALHKHLARFDLDIQEIRDHYPEYFA